MENKHWLSIVLAAICILKSHAMLKEGDMTLSKQTEYFKPANLTCDNRHLNLTENWGKIESIRWMLPDASLITETTGNIQIVKANDFPYMISIERVSDDEFGYYTCIIVYRRVGGQTSDIKVVRWALNVDGPDFTRLRAEYADHAIVGAIAAGILLGIMGITCIIWHYRYSARKTTDKNSASDRSSQMYTNTAYDAVDIQSEKPAGEQPNGSSAQGVSSTEAIDVHM